MAGLNIFGGEDEGSTFRRWDGNAHGWVTEYSAVWPVVRADLKYGINTRVAADWNSKVLAEISQQFETGCTIEVQTDFVFDGLEMPTKMVNNRPEPVPLHIRGACPAVKVLNINPDIPGAFWFDSFDTGDPLGKISLTRSLTPIWRFENLQISSKSKGMYFGGWPPSLNEVHFLGCDDWGLHLKQCYKITLPRVIAVRCKRGIKLELVGQAEFGVLQAQSCDLGIELNAGVIGGSINGESNQQNFILDGCEAGALRFYQESQQVPSIIHNSSLDFVGAKATFDVWPIDWDDYSKQHCTINGVPLMARIPVHFVVKNPLVKLVAPPPEGVVGEPFDWTMQFSGPVNSVRQLTPLPQGWTFDGTRRISGTATAPFDADVVFEVV